MNISLIIPAFIAGILTFLAPCTLPLVPGYLAFISGVDPEDLKDPEKRKEVRKKILVNGMLYTLGFSIVFIILGSAFGLLGQVLNENRIWLARIGGTLVIFFGLYLMHVFKLPVFDFLNKQKKMTFGSHLTPGKPTSSLLFGAIFALGWTPCVGPVLGSILLLSSTSGSVIGGMFLLAVFSLGLAIPFWLVALGFGHAAAYVKKISKYLNIISFVGGVFLLFIGVLLVFDKLGIWVGYAYELLKVFNYDSLLDYL